MVHECVIETVSIMHYNMQDQNCMCVVLGLAGAGPQKFQGGLENLATHTNKIHTALMQRYHTDVSIAQMLASVLFLGVFIFLNI